MGIRKLSISIVVLAQDYNPATLHPAFLSFEGIVPASWELAEPPVCVPPISIVKYKNGIDFTLQRNKLQIVQSPPPSKWDDSPLPQLAEKYIEKLSFVRYKAVGINMALVLINSKPEEFLMTRFLVLDRCNFESLRLKAVGFRFSYAVDRAILNLACDPGKVQLRESAEEVSGVIINANYHHELVGPDAAKEAKEAISTFKNRCLHLENAVLVKIFGTEGKK